MGLLLPQPANATSPEPGPLWATDLNAAFTAIDSHDHSTGKGPKVTPAGLSMTADLPFLVSGAYHGPTLMGYLGFYNNPSAAQAAQPNTGMFVKAGDLYYRNASAADVQITSGGTLNVNVTNAYAGFYGQYANGTSSANAVAYFNNTTKTYEFNLSTPTTPLGYSNVARIYGLGFAAISGGVAGVGFIAPDSAKMSSYPSAPKGNWAMKNAGTNGITWTLAWDNKDTTGTCAGDYVNYALTVAPALGTPVAMQFRMGLNVPNSVGSPGVRTAPQYPFDLNWWDSTTAGPQNMMAMTAYSSGAPAANFGPRLNILASTSTWAANANGSVITVNAVAPSAQGAVDGFWQTVATRAGGIRLRGAFGGSYSTTPGIEIAGLTAGTDYIGVGGAATTNGLMTVYGVIVPNTTGRDLGTNSLYFNNLYTNGIISPTTLFLTGTTLAISGNTGVTGTFAASSTVQGTRFIPTGTATNGTAESGTNNAVRAWAKLTDAAGVGVVTDGYNVTSVVYTNLGFYAQYDVTFSTNVAANNAFIATAWSSDTANPPSACWAVSTGANTCRIVAARNGGTLVGVNLMVVGK